MKYLLSALHRCSVPRRRATLPGSVSFSLALILAIACGSLDERDFSGPPSDQLGGKSGDGDGDTGGSGDGDGDGDGDTGGTGGGDGDGDTGGTGDGDGDTGGTGGGDGDGDTGGTGGGDGDGDGDGDMCGIHQQAVDGGCECVAGHTGSDCMECDNGFQDHDEDGACLPACDADSCSGVGTCDDSSGSVVCACPGLRAGDDCERCSKGFDLLSNESCAFIGGIVENGNFADDSAWTLTRDAEIKTTTKVGVITEDALCTGGNITQTVELPSATGTPPLVLRFKAWTNSSDPTALAVRIGEVTHQAELAGSAPAQANNVLCLGAGSLSGERELSFGPGMLPGTCPDGNISIDDVEIVVDEDDACANSDGVVAGDFDVSTGWELRNATISGGQLHLTAANQCSLSDGQPRALQPIRVPTLEQNPGAAIALKYQTGDSNGSSVCGSGSCKEHVYVSLRSSSSSNPILIGDFQSESATAGVACIPPQLRGAAGDLQINVGRGFPSSGCSSVYSYGSIVEDIALVDEPACRVQNGIMDGTFEQDSAPNHLLGWKYTAANSSFQKELENASAPQGDNNMLFGNAEACLGASIQTPFVIPVTQGDRRAAVTFQYQMPTPSQEGLAFEVCTSLGCSALSPSSNFRKHVVCVDPYAIGGGLADELLLRPKNDGTAVCDTGGTVNVIRADDIRVGTDPSCE